MKNYIIQHYTTLKVGLFPQCFPSENERVNNQGKQPTRRTMKGKVTNAIVWDHRGRVKKGCLGQLEVSDGRKKIILLRTGIRVRESEFVAGHIVNCPGADELNKRLAIIYTKVLACVNTRVESHTPINTEEIRSEIWQTVEDQSDGSAFVDWCEQQIPLLGISAGTAKTLRATDCPSCGVWQDEKMA